MTHYNERSLCETYNGALPSNILQQVLTYNLLKILVGNPNIDLTTLNHVTRIVHLSFRNAKRVVETLDGCNNPCQSSLLPPVWPSYIAHGPKLRH
jgi:hypothetical protein